MSLLVATDSFGGGIVFGLATVAVGLFGVCRPFSIVRSSRRLWARRHGWVAETQALTGRQIRGYRLFYALMAALGIAAMVHAAALT